MVADQRGGFFALVIQVDDFAGNADSEECDV
jgi:hypothetical protein